MLGQTCDTGPARRGTRRPHGWTGVAVLLAALVITQVACTNLIVLPAPAVVKAVISGTVYGDQLHDQQAGKTVAAPLLATVRCNEASVHTTADGSYRLSVSQATQYACAASAPTYALARAVLEGSLGLALRLDFGGPAHVAACGVPAPAATASGGAAPSATRARATPTPTTSPGASGAILTALVCPELHLDTGSVKGVVTNADDHTPVAGARLTCWNPHTPDTDTTPPGTYQTETDANGAFAFADLPVDRYLCTAGGDPRPTVMSPSPGVTTTVAVAMCGKHCPSVTYQGGTVMHRMTAYIVFWLPGGHLYSSVGNAHFEGLMQRYFGDVGGTSYYNIVTQYWDTSTGFMLNQVSLGGVYVDTHPYPHAGTRADPLFPTDIQQEAQAAVAARNWTSDTTHAVFIYTAYGTELCDNGAARLCTYPHGSQEVFCGYHSLTGQQLIFALIADTPSCTGAADVNPYGSPNGDRLADQALLTTSHEQFELATDPDTRGWWGGDASTGEIADKCVQSYRAVTLNGHPYWVQAEWSDRSNSCVYGL